MEHVQSFLAPAKVNLALHVTGQRDDGYHLLDSLVVFSGFGDEIRIKVAKNRISGDHKLTISGPFSKDLKTKDDNLILQAARLIENLPALDIHLVKKLPIASGIGGGSTNAATTLRAITTLFHCDLPSDEAILSLGADVPVCVKKTPVKMAGIGEKLETLPPLPKFYIVLVNSLVGVSTPKIFKSLKQKDNAPLTDLSRNTFSTPIAFCNWLKNNRNDLEPIATDLEFDIERTLEAISMTENVLLSRMSGSGATCFGLYETKKDAEKAARQLQKGCPEWWVVASSILI